MTDTPFKAIFSHAYRRIWSGRANPVLEILFWIIAAVYIGFTFYGLTWTEFEFWARVSYGMMLIQTPIVIGGSVLKAHVSVGIGDAALRNVPLRPHEVIWPRMCAVLLTWFQLVGPWVFILVAAIGQQLSFTAIGPCRTWLGLVAFHLMLISAEGELFLSGSLKVLPVWQHLAVYLLAILQWLGWVTLPLTWGFWWGSRFHQQGWPFLLAFVSYLIMPALLVLMVHLGFHRLFIGLSEPYWTIMLTVGLSGIVLSFYFFYKACWTWGRRSA